MPKLSQSVNLDREEVTDQYFRTKASVSSQFAGSKMSSARFNVSTRKGARGREGPTLMDVDSIDEIIEQRSQVVPVPELSATKLQPAEVRRTGL